MEVINDSLTKKIYDETEICIERLMLLKTRRNVKTQRNEIVHRLCIPKLMPVDCYNMFWNTPFRDDSRFLSSKQQLLHHIEEERCTKGQTKNCRHTHTHSYIIIRRTKRTKSNMHNKNKENERSVGTKNTCTMCTQTKRKRRGKTERIRSRERREWTREKNEGEKKAQIL